MPYFGIFGLEFEKTIVIFEINAFEFVKMQSFMLKVQSCKLKKNTDK